ncbi:MAG: hypothetical protein UT14_C0033G0002 [Candidatus Shapirobacteria bacterium GW2011_GWE1_38_92]|uniref:Glycoside hydrolase family 43 n=2 Tax=Candidatus Shapironibacteriota TaxID=1752721 RepID=A0A0G0LHV5_9BACT|nr:MAG: hypothetical protein UT14_C0033G0002 [Candidatus Shapirobacteria bacterium GW2011_GWE1_38_92]
MKMRFWIFIFVCGWFFGILTPKSVVAVEVSCVNNQQTYWSEIARNGFGQTVMYKVGWDRYLLYLGITSIVKDGKLVNPTSGTGDPGTYNSICKGWAADRIWMTWHFGDGISKAGWWSDPGTPRLLLNPGGVGEGALIADPTVVEWKGKVHMYYEGTDNCSGNDNRIFHAVADSLFGPFTKTGEVIGLAGHKEAGTSALSWPKVFVENDKLYLYYTDSYLQLLVARATNDAGTVFTMENNGKSAVAETTNIGEVKKKGDKYYLVYTKFMGGIRISESSDKFNFPVGKDLITAGKYFWDKHSVGLPTWITKEENGVDRVYYGAIEKVENGFVTSSVATCDLRFVLPTLVPTKVPTAVPTKIPTAVPTKVPTKIPTAVPTSPPVGTCGCDRQGRRAGDGNCDGLVDLRDFEVWRSEMFDLGGWQGVSRPDWKGDFNCDWKVDLLDFEIWRRNR